MGIFDSPHLAGAQSSVPIRRSDPGASIPTAFEEACAVMTTFDPDDDLPGRVQKVLEQVPELIIVNDSGRPELSQRLDVWFRGNSRIVLHHNHANSGIAASLNTGVREALRLGYGWILTLDDDSTLVPGIVSRMLTWRKSVGPSIAISGPMVAYRGMVRSTNEASSTTVLRSVEKRAVITSCMLFPAIAYKEIGEFREEFFIDKVDIDYCLRARALGRKVLQFGEFGIIHRLGQPSVKQIFGIAVRLRNYPPSRVYYQFRNITSLVKEYSLREPLFCIVALMNMAGTFLKITLWEDQRRSKIAGALRGIADGLRRRFNRY